MPAHQRIMHLNLASLRIQSLLVFLLAILLYASPLLADLEPARPNVLIILVDDMRFDQMTHEGHPYIETPSLDRLAREGVRLTNAYVTSPLCGPSRASMMTGRQPSAHGRLHNFAYPTLQPYLPASFRTAGYRTAMIGKFYEGPALAKQVRGEVFDRWFANGGPYWPDYQGDPDDAAARKAFYNERMYYDQFYDIDGATRQVMGHQTDVLFDEAVRFAFESAEQNRPFFMLLNPFAPHTPLNPSLGRKGKHAGRGIPPRPNQLFGSVGPMRDAANKDRMAEVHERGAEMIEDVDEALGRCLDALDSAGLLDDTLLVFTSDNGTVHGEHGFWWKMSFWQEAIRVPMLIRYPKLAQAGTTQDALVSITDVLMTAADAGGVSLPDDDRRYGRSLVPLLRGNGIGRRETLLCMQYSQPKSRAAPEPISELQWASLTTDDGWKLVAQRVPSPQVASLPKLMLFRISEDPYEMNNLAELPEHRDMLDALQQRLADELTEQAAPADWLR